MEVALHTRLRPGAEQAYELAHREVPPLLLEAIRAVGVTSWTIWRSGAGAAQTLPVVWRL